MNLITDRKSANSTRLAQLSNKPWGQMTLSERAEWSGNPLTASDFGYNSGVNLIPPFGTNVKFRDGSIIADEDGTVVIGEASDFSGNSVTLSVEYMSGDGLALVWSDGTPAGCALTAAGEVTATLGSSSGTQLLLAVSKGYYGKVMLELGRVRHNYVPYTEIVPNEATKGAYNFSDLNRVERAVAEIAEILAVSLETKTDWNMWDIPTKTDMARYLGNVRLLQELCKETTMLPENMDKLSYSTANLIEEVLLTCRSIAEGSHRCGEIICGEVS